MTRVLVSCPNMVEVIDEFMADLVARGYEVDTSDAHQQLSEEELLEMIPRYDGVIAGDDPFTRRVIERGAANRLRTIAKWGVGTDNIDRGAAQRHGITVTNTPGVFGDEVADVAVGYLVMLARQLHRIDAAVRQGHWFKPVGRSLAGSTIGIVGLGSIGSSLVRRALAMGMQVVGTDPSEAAREGAVALGATVTALGEVVSRSDFLVLCCPMSPENLHLIDGRRLASMKKDAFLVNVSRGPLVDQAALVDNLRGGHLAGAALDVFEVEPVPADDPLIELDNVILGSHNGSNSAQAVRRVSAMAIANLALGLGAER